MSDSHTDTTPDGSDVDALEQRTIAWLFGDEDEDPGLIAAEAAQRPDFTTWLDAFALTHEQLKAALAPGGCTLARERLAVLRDDITRRREGGIDWNAARGDNVRSLDAARVRSANEVAARDKEVADAARPSRAVADSIRARPVPTQASRTTRIALIGSIVLAAAAAIFLVLSGGSKVPDVDAGIATLLVEDIAPAGGFGFAGATPPSAHDRGFLIGAVIDLSRPRADKSAPAVPDVKLAQNLSDRTLLGLEAPDDAEARRERVISGCAAILVDAADRQACEKGLADYIARRDAFFSIR